MSTTLAYYILAAILGAFLTWLLVGGNKKRLLDLEANSKKERTALNDLLTEFKLFKSDAQSQLRLKDNELSKLKKSKAFPDVIADAQEKEITHWKKKAKELEKRMSTSSSKNNGSPSAEDKAELKKIKQKLLAAEKTIKTKELIIEKMETSKKMTHSKSVGEKDSSKKKIEKLKKEIKANKKKLKAKPKKEIIEIKETLDLSKLRKLLKQGKLTKKSKKVLKGKKKKRKSKKASPEKIETPSFSKGKSILDIIPELKTGSQL